MITTDELKVQLAEHAKAVKDLEEALAIEASRKRVQELEHTMSRPGFYDDAELSKKVFDEVGDLKGKLNRFEKLQGLYDDAETMLEMLDEEYDPAMIPEAEEAVNTVGKAVEELQLMTMLNGEYDHSNAILTFHAGTGGTEAQDWAEMLYRMYNKWAQAHGMTVEVLDYQDGDEAGLKSASMMVKGANAYGMLKSEHTVWCVFLPLTPTPAARPALPLWRLCPSWTTPFRWTSAPRISRCRCTAPPVPAASTSTRPLPLSV